MAGGENNVTSLLASPPGYFFFFLCFVLAGVATMAPTSWKMERQYFQVFTLDDATAGLSTGGGRGEGGKYMPASFSMPVSFPQIPRAVHLTHTHTRTRTRYPDL